MNIAHPLSLLCAAPPTPANDPAEEHPRGCGWFESSHELLTGLSITEHDSPDRVANELALEVWLSWHLAGQVPQATTRASSAL